MSLVFMEATQINLEAVDTQLSTLLITDNLVKEYRKRRVVNGVSLRVEQG